ncbi:guanylate kinase [Roseiterribacter gracilis]|uniref:Guanylate kinase n=1 Tax=Roseiterribacter gracilis TaxID=2812848 RepID=A0A8S8X9M9_9PROT|nr:guanylate kinase [Rhodospirillales bacterium TMPK1]
MDPEITRRGLLLVLSSPSGAGKTSIARALLDSDPNLSLSVSVTTRPMRAGERDGVDYDFIGKAEFQSLVERGALIEHAEVFGNHYGTPRAPVEDALTAGRDMLFDIDWQGTQQISEGLTEDIVTVFVLPPSTDELEKRLRGRALDSEDVIRRRMAKSADEMSHYREYQYVLVNRALDESVYAVRAILTAERLKRRRQHGLVDFVNRLRRESGG